MTATELKTTLPESKLSTQKQVKKIEKRFFKNDNACNLRIELRYDDDCGNGYNSFSITATLYENGIDVAAGCLHDEIKKHAPELEKYIKWHLCSSDGPLYYVANTLYHIDEHPETHAWIYYTGGIDPLNLAGKAERVVGYEKREVALQAEGKPGYRIEWDKKTIKEKNMEHARHCAIWPEATESELKSEIALNNRLPALMEEFKKAMLELGFEY